jgi:hypothetical protein
LRAVCGVMRAVRKEQHAADTSRWWLKGCFCFITFDSELEWCCRKSVQDGRCIKVVDYSVVVDVAMDGLPTRLKSRFVRGYVRNDLGKAVVWRVVFA